MLTKDQERGVLNKIVKLIESTGNDSYISTAFAGCVKDAEANIEDDAAYSWMDRAAAAEVKLHQALKEVETYKERAANLETLRVEQNRRACEAEKRADELQAEINQLRQIKAQYEALQQVHEQETTKLKSRLYDLITKEN